ncbi:MAG: SDR family oxidoreductase [Proteobacteria bacterium]|nr:SDR family oxidoreductase [Pseudomonadota bacterium]
MADRLKDKVAIVTGAGSVSEGWGNGKAAAVLYAREGAKVLAVDINLEAAEECGRIIAGEGGRCVAVRADVSKDKDVHTMVETCVETFGRVDVLHNNVGIVEVGGPVETTEESWDRVIAVNLKSMFLTCKHVLPLMVDQGGGAIVNISSITAIRYLGVPYIAYSSTKAAIIQFTKSVALQYADRNVRANVILPGHVDTPMVRESLAGAYADGDVDKMIEIRNAQCPMKKMGDAWDVAHAALFLASDEARYITGAELVVDGGLSCRAV